MKKQLKDKVYRQLTPEAFSRLDLNDIMALKTETAGSEDHFTASKLSLAALAARAFISETRLCVENIYGAVYQVNIVRLHSVTLPATRESWA
ncbi:hypothetical protein ACROYT_G004497 [Oculina patagonica]